MKISQESPGEMRSRTLHIYNRRCFVLTGDRVHTRCSYGLFPVYIQLDIKAYTGYTENAHL